MHGVGLPGHFIVGSSDDRDLFIDPFDSGRVLDRAGVRERYRTMSGGSPTWHDVWLAPQPVPAIIVRMLNNLKVSHERREDVVGLRAVMRLRAAFPELEAAERDEFARLMAPTN